MSISQNFPDEGPTLSLNFASSKTLDPRITFTRASTGTYTDDNGLVVIAPADAPRFDHNPTTGESLGLLIEESRTNLYDNTINFGSSNWALQTSPEVTLNTTDVSSPDGTYSAVKWTPTTTLSQYVYDSVGSLGSSLTYTMSVWVRTPEGESTTFQMNLYSPTQQSPVLTATDTWKRFTWTFTPQNQVSAYPVIVRELNKSLYIWGPQIEVGSFPTSYIPTEGSTVTRTADNASITGSNFIELYGGILNASIVVNCKTPLASTEFDNRIISFRPTSGINSYDITFRLGNNPTISLRTISDYALSNQIIPFDTTTRISASISSGDLAISCNGESPVTSSASITGTFDVLDIGRFNPSPYRYLNSTISQLTYYPQRLPNSQLIALTR